MAKKFYEDYKPVTNLRDAAQCQGDAFDRAVIADESKSDPDFAALVENDVHNRAVDYARARYTMGLRERDYDWESEL